ncbi:Protein accelerated cell death 6 [Heracleum sosnowskyi]|uniref:Protein accelerated cell death 6 n=1 Tax=Heracleum sosnowskyi TaxID=360622 RepID=A0AAD8HRX3_9APIA|nr:Protein accelerated cell death 6 [Heracleum sosnowskyi]
MITPLRNTVLHVAASFGNEDLVRFLAYHFRSLLSKRNHRGDTALHLAAIAGHLGVVDVLVRFQMDQLNKDSLLEVDVEKNNETLIGKFEETVVVNNDGNTPLHEALKNNHEKVAEYLKRIREIDFRLTWMALKSAGTERAKLKNKPGLEKLKSATYETYNMDFSKDRVNTLLLVSTLIATVTFAAGFTMPGGYSISEPDQGMATLLNKLTFQVFVICDTIAMYCAIMVAVTLIWAQLGDLTLVLNALKVAIPLLGISLTMMLLEFMAGVYLVVSKLVWLADVVMILGIISLACLLSLFIPLNLPYTSTLTILRYISYYPFCLLMLASGSYYDPVEHDSF